MITFDGNLKDKSAAEAMAGMYNDIQSICNEYKPHNNEPIIVAQASNLLPKDDAEYIGKLLSDRFHSLSDTDMLLEGDRIIRLMELYVSEEKAEQMKRDLTV